MSDFATTELHTSDEPHWLFNLDSLDVGKHNISAVAEAKSAVAKTKNIRYRNLRGRKVNPRGLLDEYVIVVKVK
jgi:hypothetical protein